MGDSRRLLSGGRRECVRDRKGRQMIRRKSRQFILRLTPAQLAEKTAALQKWNERAKVDRPVNAVEAFPLPQRKGREKQ